MARKSTRKSTPTVSARGNALGVKLTNEQLDELAVKVFIPHLEAGGQMQELRAQYGSGPRIRKALYRAGFTPIGAQRGDIKPISPKATAKTVTNFIVKGRQAGKSFDRLAHETHRTVAEVKEILNKANQGELAHGRVVLRQS
jgi:hypothetical protein